MGIVVVGQYQIDGFGGPWDALWVVPCLWLTDGKDPPPPPRPRGRAGRQPQSLLAPVAALPPGGPRGPPSVDAGSALRFSAEMTPVTCDADLGFAQVTPATQGGGCSPPPPDY